MKQQKTLIQIICLPSDIDNLERTLLLLSQNSLFVDKTQDYLILDVSLLVSDFLVDWESSIIKKDFFTKKFNNLKTYTEWADEVYFNEDDTSYGGCDRSTCNIQKYDVDNVIWLDVDIMFNPYTLSTFLSSSRIIDHPRYIITPSLVKLWDHTWDPLVNPHFLQEPFKYNETNNSILDTNQDYGEISLTPLPEFKFAGGWFTLLSKNLLDYLELPLVKGFTPIDTWIMQVCNHLPETTQYKINNLVVCEDRKSTFRDTYKNYVTFTGKNMDFYQTSYSQLTNHFDTVLRHKM